MPIDAKYGRVSLEYMPKSMQDDEPVFVIRAQDALAAQTIAYYRDLYMESAKATSSFLEALRDVLVTFRKWYGTRKLPD